MSSDSAIWLIIIINSQLHNCPWRKEVVQERTQEVSLKKAPHRRWRTEKSLGRKKRRSLGSWRDNDPDKLRMTNVSECEDMYIFIIVWLWVTKKVQYNFQWRMLQFFFFVLCRDRRIRRGLSPSFMRPASFPYTHSRFAHTENHPKMIRHRG